jgi:sarcosine oxidase subunit beta
MVLALRGPQPYTPRMPVFKDLGSAGMLYCRCYGGSQMLVSEGIAGETLAEPNNEQGVISMDHVLDVGAQVAERFPSYETADLASSWTGVYDVTPDWTRCWAAYRTCAASSSHTDSPGTGSSCRRWWAAC